MALQVQRCGVMGAPDHVNLHASGLRQGNFVQQVFMPENPPALLRIMAAPQRKRPAMFHDLASLYLPDLLLILTVFVIGAASPGPATLMIMNTAARQGRLAGVFLSFGIVTGSIFWASVAALGFVAALKTSVLLFTAMKLAGGAYLLFLAFRALRSAATRTRPDAPAPAPEPVSFRRQYMRGLLLHLTNPKAPLVWMATLSALLRLW